jgi:hypothetical protein
MTMNVDFSARELESSELEAISGGFHITFGGNPPRGDSGGDCHHESYGGHEGHHGYEPPPRYFAGGTPNDPALRPRY